MSLKTSSFRLFAGPFSDCLKRGTSTQSGSYIKMEDLKLKLLEKSISNFRNSIRQQTSQRRYENGK